MHQRLRNYLLSPLLQRSEDTKPKSIKTKSCPRINARYSTFVCGQRGAAA
jgi:hypothetical protein